MTHDSHQIAVAARLDPQDAEATLGAVERHPLDETGKNLAARMTLLDDCAHRFEYCAQAWAVARSWNG